MKTRALLISICAGLACGLAIRSVTAHRPSKTATPSTVSRPATSGNALPESISDVSSATIPTAASSWFAGEAAALRLMRAGSGRDAISGGIQTINAEDGWRFQDYWATIFTQWADEAPDEALAAAEHIHYPIARAMLVQFVFSNYAKTGVGGLMRKALDLRDSISREAALRGLAQTAGPETAPALLREWMSLADDEAQGLMRSFAVSLFQNLSQEDPAAPLRIALEFNEPGPRTRLINAALQTDPDGTPWKSTSDTTVLIDLAKDPRNAAGLSQAMADLTAASPEEGLKVLTTMPEGPEKAGLIAGSARIAICDPFRPGEDKPDVVFLQLDRLCKIYETHRLTAEFRDALIHEGMRSSPGNLGLAVEWFTAHDPTAAERLTLLAAEKMPMLTADWLAAIPPSAKRDRSVAVFAETHAAVDSESATVWAESISDPAERAASLAAVRKSPQKPR